MNPTNLLVCCHCLIPVRQVPTPKKVWTKGEIFDRWAHLAGFVTCGRQFLSSDEIEEAGDPTPAEVPVQD